MSFSHLCRVLTLILLLPTTVWSATVPIEPGVSLALAESRAARVTGVSYQLTLDIPADQEQPIDGRIVIDFELSDNSEPLQLDFNQDAGHLRRVRSTSSRDSNGNALAGAAYRFEQEHLLILPQALRKGRNRLEIEFVAGDSSLNRNPDFLYTLFVPDRARTAFPLFDQPDIKARYQLNLTVPADWDAVANAPLEHKQSAEGRSTYRFALSEPNSSYLFSFVAGQFQRVTRSIDGREINLLHRETDREKLARNMDSIFELHAASLRWLEAYTGIPYPFAKFDMALIPSFQYGGMEHPGAIQYRASDLFLDASPTDVQLLNRATLIAHETAHMWFGNLVTMKWFNDVWTKEVFANFMAAKIVQPSFEDIDHQLSFLLDHYPGAYRVDRSDGSNPIRQSLANLNQAGQMYGPIIYLKAPIMMRQLELVVGERNFRLGMQKYLQAFAFGNATWPDLIAILDPLTGQDLQRWSEVWVNSPGRPRFQVDKDTGGKLSLQQQDVAGLGRTWPQQFDIDFGDRKQTVSSADQPVALAEEPVQLNSDGLGYGLFPVEAAQLAGLQNKEALARGALLIDAWENFLEGKLTSPDRYLTFLLENIDAEQNQLILGELLAQLYRVHSSFLDSAAQRAVQLQLENTLISGLEAAADPGRARLFLESYSQLARTTRGLEYLRDIWDGSVELESLSLSENDRIALAENLAIGLPEQAAAILASQRKQIENPDNLRRFDFVAAALSPEAAIRDEFFASLAEVEQRATEIWVLDALDYLHHPTRVSHAGKYILPSLELLEEIQVTGDIFFPAGWVSASLRNHYSPAVVETVAAFLRERPHYNPQLRLKILQSVDMPERASKYHQR
ncbi:peptidase M1 [Seongchinamella unica]|uniref:Aminopeptidase N n=1 Tax=Seongchinamella unica TaxID=2547392 RepID=A0A4V6PIW8_9GAMM|nr:M1 family aminopeptidase [Seongchinamella unica]TDG12673.1 peptidase M1 [Seongchinamella unica]